MPVKVMIVDDHAVVRAGLRALIKGEPGMELVGEATNGEDALQIASQMQPDIIVLDLSLPGMDGIQITRIIKQEQPRVRILILTVHEDAALLREALRAGASGYILKHAAENELISAIHSVLLEDIYIHPKMIRSLLIEPKTPKVTESSQVELLTPRETDILLLIVQGYTNRQIAEELSLSVRTVEGHRSNLMEKLGLHSRVELVRYAREHGLTNRNVNS
ncbi:MAG: DNA-binding response regulator [Chloroflexi bacterium]|nr:MAG: DNA-binding response regulator [Chloroflexota bacterium]